MLIINIKTDPKHRQMSHKKQKQKMTCHLTIQNIVTKYSLDRLNVQYAWIIVIQTDYKAHRWHSHKVTNFELVVGVKNSSIIPIKIGAGLQSDE